jgi:hypothetical protein
MRIDELSAKTEAGFKEVRTEFENVRAEMRTEFENVRAEMRAGFAEVRAEMHGGFKEAADNLHAGLQGVRAELRSEIAMSAQSVTATLRSEIKAEGEVTRRHFDVVAEQFREYTKLLADGIARNTERLDNHETRITAIERGRQA